MLTNCLAACAHLIITVSEIQRDIGRKSSIFYTPLAFDAPVRGFPVGIAPPRLVWKNENGLSTTWWKHFEDIFIRFGATHERDRRKDGRTDGRTPHAGNSRAMHSIARQKWYTIQLFLKWQTNGKLWGLLWSIEWRHFRWPWMTLNPDFKGTPVFDV